MQLAMRRRHYLTSMTCWLKCGVIRKEGGVQDVGLPCLHNDCPVTVYLRRFFSPLLLYAPQHMLLTRSTQGTKNSFQKVACDLGSR